MLYLMLILNCQSLLEIIWASRDIDTVCFHRTCIAVNLHCSIPPAVRIDEGLQAAFTSLHPCDVHFYGLHERLPS